MIEEIITSLEQLTRKDLRRITNIDFTVNKILSKSPNELLELCEGNYDNYIRLRIQIAKIYIFDLSNQDYAQAFSILNNLLQLCEFDGISQLYKFELMYLKTLVHHFLRNSEQAYFLANRIYEMFYTDATVKDRFVMDKLMGMTSSDPKEAIEHSFKALNYLNKFEEDKTERGWINKNLAFYYLNSGNISTSIDHLIEFLKLSPNMDDPQSFEILVISGYISKLKERSGEVSVEEYTNQIEELIPKISTMNTANATDVSIKNKRREMIKTLLDLSTGLNDQD